MKKLFLAMVSAALALSGQTAIAATKTLTVASWAGPKHVMNSTFPLLSEAAGKLFWGQPEFEG